jgi:hypothetical protein
MAVDWRNLPGVQFCLPYEEGTRQGVTVRVYALDFTFRDIMMDKKAETKDKVPAKTFHMRMPDGSFLYGNIIKKPARRM